MKDNIYNKEDEYKKEIFDLLSDDFKKTTEDPIILNLLKELFLADENDIDNEEMLNSLLTDNISPDAAVKDTQIENFKEIIENEATTSSVKKVLFYDENYPDIQRVAEKTVEDE